MSKIRILPRGGITEHEKSYLVYECGCKVVFGEGWKLCEQHQLIDNIEDQLEKECGPPTCSHCGSDARRQKCMWDLGALCPRNSTADNWIAILKQKYDDISEDKMKGHKKYQRVIVLDAPITNRYWQEGDLAVVNEDSGQIRIHGAWFDLDERWKYLTDYTIQSPRIQSLEEIEKEQDRLWKKRKEVEQEIISEESPVLPGDLVIIRQAPDHRYEIVRGEVSTVGIDRYRESQYNPQLDDWRPAKGWTFFVRVNPYVKDLSRPKHGAEHRHVQLNPQVDIEVVKKGEGHDKNV